MGHAESRSRRDISVFVAAGRRGRGMTGAEPTVFVIDDDRAVRSAIKNVLESVGLRAEIFA